MIELARKYLEKIENFPIKFFQLIAWVYFICVARSFLEAFTNKKMQFDNLLPALIHNPVYYLVHFLVIALVFFIFTRADVSKIIKTIFLFSFFIFVCPLVDYFFPWHQLQSYINVESWDMAARAYLTIGLNDIYLQGSSLGLKMEGVLALLGVAVYLLLKRVNFIPAVLGSLLVYSIIVLFAMMPTIFHVIYSGLGLEYAEKNGEFVIFQYLLLGVFALLLYYFKSAEKFLAFAKTINWFRGGITLIFFVLGLISYFYLRLDTEAFRMVLPFSLLKIFSGAIAVFLAWQASRLINDLCDFDFDKNAANKNALRLLDKQEVINILLVYLGFIAAFSLTLNYYFFSALLLCLAISYFYSGGGLHFKRHFLLASLSEASAFCLIFLAGFFVFFGQSDTFDFIPFKILHLIFLITFLAISFKDVKDQLGDRQQSVKTIYTVFGPVRGLQIVRLLILICALLPALVFANWLLLLPGLAGYCLIYFFTEGLKNINRKTAIFLITVLYLSAVIFILPLDRQKIASGEIDLSRDSGWHPGASQEIWFFSARLTDANRRPYYVFQTYSFPVGSFFTLIGLNDRRFYKEFYPDTGKMSATKNSLYLYQYISGYGDADILYQSSPASYKYHAKYEQGMIDLDLFAAKPGPVLLTESGRLPILNNGYLNYYALPNLSVSGKIIFKGEKKIMVGGEAILEHLWGSIRADYRFWTILNISLDNDAELLVNIFNYGENNLIYGALIDKDGIKRFNNLSIRAIEYFDNPDTKSRWFSELEITNDDLDFKLRLKAEPPQQEITRPKCLGRFDDSQR